MSRSLWCVARSMGSFGSSAFTVLQWLQPCIQRGANPDVSPPFGDGAQKAQAGRSPWLGHAAVFYQCWPARLLVAAAQLHRGASLIPLLCHLRSVDVLHFHLENCDKGNTLKVCKESEPVDFFFFYCWWVQTLLLLRFKQTGIFKEDKLTSPSPVCQTRYNLSWHNFNYFQAASGRWGLKRYNIGFYVWTTLLIRWIKMCSAKGINLQVNGS